MHRDFRKRLDKARGVSEFPIVLNVDIREFTKWTGDSAESGLFIKKTYIRLIDDYLQGASFYKATGDGLLVVFPVDENEPKLAVRATVNLALKIVRDFPKLTKGDPMINFPTPSAVGIGLARGPASRLVSGRKTLDYSGSTLNLASRLMDVARPQGVVLDGSFGHELLTPSVASKFDSERVYIAGIAPKIGTTIHYSAEWTEISPALKSPLEGTKWGRGLVKGTRKDLMEIPDAYLMPLDSVPIDSSSIRCYVKQDARTKNGRRSKSRWRMLDIPSEGLEYRDTPDGPFLSLQMDVVRNILEELGAGPSWLIEIHAEFEAA
jgi:class 3 adenylate cyclase